MNRRQQIEQLLLSNPEDAFLLFALAKEDEKAGKDDAALQTYQRLKERHPDYVGLYYHLGKTLERLQQEKTAWEVYTEGMAVALKLGETHARSELAGARLELGEEEDFS